MVDKQIIITAIINNEKGLLKLIEETKQKDPNNPLNYIYIDDHKLMVTTNNEYFDKFFAKNISDEWCIAIAPYMYKGKIIFINDCTTWGYIYEHGNVYSALIHYFKGSKLN